MEVVAVNVGRRERLEGPMYSGTTGIHKRPCDGPVLVGALGLADDAVCDTRHHGGPDQAVYLYRQEDYDWFAGELGRDLEPGTFGENLTVRGLPSPALPIGTRLVGPSVTLEITAPRIPCNTLAQRMGDAGFVKRFMQARRPGFYARVPVTGPIAAGEVFTLQAPTWPAADADPSAVPDTVEVFDAAKRRLALPELERFLAAPIDERTRADFEKRLRKLAG